ncbi:MAG: hypothetical protein Fur0014_01760 [Rubrivivax sp.]
MPYTALQAAGWSVQCWPAVAGHGRSTAAAGVPREFPFRGAWQLLDHPARLFVCARCRAQVLLCSRCDRGQRYCGRTCSRASRVQALRAAGRRYQDSRAGRMAHAARSRRWRQRRRERALAAVEAGDACNFVTHQGSPVPPPTAPLAAPEQAGQPLSAAGDALTAPTSAHCRRCTAPLPPWVRQGFLRHGMRRWPARVVVPHP